MTTQSCCSHDPEMLDVLDASGNQLTTAPRSQVHDEGLWHAVFHCQIVAVRDQVPHMVLQRRDVSKLAFGGLLDVSAAGHLNAGEAPHDGVRELTEELGVEVQPSQLTRLGVRRMVDDQGGEGRLNKELTHVFLLRDDRPLTQYRLAPDEVEAVFEGAASDLLALFSGEVETVALSGCLASGESAEQSFGLIDFVPDLDYWVTLAVMSERFGLGISPIAI